MANTYTVTEKMSFELGIQTAITAVELSDLPFNEKMKMKRAIQARADQYPEQRIMKPALNTQCKN